MVSTLDPIEAPGLPADWLNAWMAAIGVTVLLPDVKLSWTDEVVPHAVFWCTDASSFVDRLAEALPTVGDLERSAIAREHPESGFRFERSVPLEVFRDRAKIERRYRGFLLTATVTDLINIGHSPSVLNGPFDTPAPGGETFFSRAIRCIQEIKHPVNAVANTLDGSAKRTVGNGLGFDCRRMSTGVQV
ncbi:MAG: hypothetical protein N2037_11190, partial [Acidimicrobiales bacterium]|nr:hypothetical protein [Acidimicrobiales bacterium]